MRSWVVAPLLLLGCAQSKLPAEIYSPPTLPASYESMAEPEGGVQAYLAMCYYKDSSRTECFRKNELQPFVIAGEQP